MGTFKVFDCLIITSHHTTEQNTQLSSNQIMLTKSGTSYKNKTGQIKDGLFARLFIHMVHHNTKENSSKQTISDKPSKYEKIFQRSYSCIINIITVKQ